MTRRSYTKICEGCGVEFHPYHHNAKYCTRQCSLNSVRRGDSIKLICDNCGESYTKSAALAGRVKHNNYCSVKCKSEHNSQKVACIGCGKEFKIINSWVLPSGNYCSKKCHNQGMKVQKPILTCAFCGNRFERYPSEIKKMSERGYTHVFCSHKCRAAMIAAQFDPPKPYTGPHTSTPRNGQQIREWRKAVFERDNYTCQDCGTVDVLLCAHHIKAYILYPELRYEVSNGLTLCYPCHEKRHSLS